MTISVQVTWGGRLVVGLRPYFFFYEQPQPKNGIVCQRPAVSLV
jgi:hypothetical protein